MKLRTKVAALLLLAAPLPAATCESLATLTLPKAAITLARIVPAGAFAPPAGSSTPYQRLPEFCRITATLTPTTDSDIKIEIWLPTANWNRKFEAVGNGGWA